jgi:long-subunit acyl-CoA synthetase (AMP-forming)
VSWCCARPDGTAASRWSCGALSGHGLYPELGAIATEIACGLIALGIEAGDRVGILGETSADWTLADYGSLCAGAVVAPIYHTNSPEECAYVRFEGCATGAITLAPLRQLGSDTASSPRASGSWPTSRRSPATHACTRRSRRMVDAVDEKLARIEQIKRFAILDHDLSQAEGELTTALSRARRRELSGLGRLDGEQRAQALASTRPGRSPMIEPGT